MAGEPQFPLTDEQIRERLATNDASLIDEIHGTVKELFLFEEQRQSTIEGKATHLFGSMGLATGLLFAFGGLALEKFPPAAFAQAGLPSLTLIYLYFVVVLLGVVADIFAWSAIRVRTEYKVLAEKDIFDKKAISEGAPYYKRFITAAIWKTYRTNFEVNEKKGKCLRWAQRLFIGVLGLLVLAALLLGITVASMS